MDDHLEARESLRRLREGNVPADELYGLIHDLGHSNLLEAEPDVVAYLNHPAPSIRMIAIRVLTFHWEVRDHKEELIRLLLEDPDDWVRSFAAVGVGFVYRETKDPAIAKALLTKLSDEDEEWNVREAAYDALTNLWLPRTVDQDLEILREQFALARAESADLEQATSAQDFDRRLWLWNQEWRLKVDWNLIKEIQSAVGTKE